MRDAGILAGDYVVVRQQETAQDGEIVVAIVGEEATVKRFFKERDHVRLQPENPEMEPIRSADVRVHRQGRGSVQEDLMPVLEERISQPRADGRLFGGGDERTLDDVVVERALRRVAGRRRPVSRLRRAVVLAGGRDAVECGSCGSRLEPA